MEEEQKRDHRCLFQKNWKIRRNKSPLGSLPAVWGQIWGFPRYTWMQRRSFSLKCRCRDRSVFDTGPWFVDPSFCVSFFLRFMNFVSHNRLNVKLHLKVMFVVCNVFFLANISCAQLSFSTNSRNLPLYITVTDSQLDHRSRALNALPPLSVCVCTT